jgi:hypothetical protein
VHYLVVETFHHRDPIPVYRRFRAEGRLAPEGLSYITSWITDDMTRCYQIMEAADRGLLEEWMARWCDLIDFEVFPVLTSAEVQRRLAPRLE